MILCVFTPVRSCVFMPFLQIAAVFSRLLVLFRFIIFVALASFMVTPLTMVTAMSAYTGYHRHHFPPRFAYSVGPSSRAPAPTSIYMDRQALGASPIHGVVHTSVPYRPAMLSAPTNTVTYYRSPAGPAAFPSHPISMYGAVPPPPASHPPYRSAGNSRPVIVHRRKKRPAVVIMEDDDDSNERP